MRKKKIRIFALVAVVFTMATLFSLVCYAQFDMMGHHDPDGSTFEYNAYPADQCNRTVNITYRDTNGNFIMKGILHTKYGAENSFHIGIGGYDIVKFESNQGLWETCKIVWTSGGVLGDEFDLFVDYYFRTRMSKKELNIEVTARKWDSIRFEVRHYVEIEKLNHFHRDNYKFHSVTDKKVLDYYDPFTVKAKRIYGYTLNPQYKSTLSERLCLKGLIGKYPNFPSSPRFYSYDLHQTNWGEDMKTFSSFDENKDGKMDWCNNRKVVIEFLYDINAYTIKFDTNGGLGSPADITKFHGEDITLPTDKPTRYGYTFVGWGTYRNDTRPNYQPGGKYTANSSITLYAIWDPESYIISYDANGGIGDPTNQSKYFDRDIYLSNSKPSRTGYEFLGWGTYASDRSANYHPGDLYTGNAPLYLYAIWRPNGYSIRYNANGGSGGPTAVQTKYHDRDLHLFSSQPNREGYTFMGWGTYASDTTPDYQPGEVYSKNVAVTLYAIWRSNETPTYMIVFDPNGGYNAPPSIVKTQGLWIALPTGIPERYQYDFLGWSDSKYATSPTYQPGEIFNRDADTTLYAIWDYNPTYTITFDANGGSRGPSSITKKYMVSVKLPTSVPYRSGYEFLGWNMYSFASDAAFYPGGTYTREGDTTLYAVWKKVEIPYDIGVEAVLPNSHYVAGTTVISSFTMTNSKSRDVLPSDNNTVQFTVYYYNGGSKVIVTTQKWQQAVIPKNGNNLVYFKWTVPSNLAGKTIYCECTVNADRSFMELSYANNTASFTNVVDQKVNSQTPDTKFESGKPPHYHHLNPPTEKKAEATWSMWVYENGRLVEKQYGLRLNSGSPLILPSDNCLSAKFEHGQWVMKSGYGITLKYDPRLSSFGGYLLPDYGAFTSIQNVNAYFAEFDYKSGYGEYRTLEKVGTEYMFESNPNATGSAREHFIPLYVEDGKYVVSVEISDIWTPVGMISGRVHSNTINIKGTIYDDWYGN